MAALIYEQIPKVMQDVGSVAKTGRNQQQNYAFRGIEAMYAAVHPALIKHGVFCAPEVMDRTEYRFDKTNFDGKSTTWLHVTLKVRHRFYATDGSYVDVITVGEGLDNSDKASNKALSGAMKYALIELFTVPTVDVADSDRDTPETGSAAKVVVARPPVKTPEKPMLSSTSQTILPAQPIGFTKITVEGAEIFADKVQSAPLPKPETEYITAAQCGTIAKRFRESLKPELASEAEVFRHDALRHLGMIDKDGNPSSSVIKKSEYAIVGAKLIEFARGL